MVAVPSMRIYSGGLLGGVEGTGEWVLRVTSVRGSGGHGFHCPPLGEVPGQDLPQGTGLLVLNHPVDKSFDGESPRL